MKTWLTVLLTALLLLLLTGCDAETGITVVNNLGVDLTYLEIMNQEELGTTWGDGMANGASDLAYVHQGAEGTVCIQATDTYGSTYALPAVYVHDGVELRLELEEGILYARHFYEDTLWEETGLYDPGFDAPVTVPDVEPDAEPDVEPAPYTPVEADPVEPIEPEVDVSGTPNGILMGSWAHSDEDYSITFDGVKSFSWNCYEGIVNGTYQYDGDYTVELHYDGIVRYFSYNSEGDYLVEEGDAGSWYSRQS